METRFLDKEKNKTKCFCNNSWYL